VGQDRGGVLEFILVPGPGVKAVRCLVQGLVVGTVFPLLVGTLAESVGIARSYWFCAAAVAGLLAGAMVMRSGHRAAGATGIGAG
jgi:hypothetical protein